MISNIEEEMGRVFRYSPNIGVPDMPGQLYQCRKIIKINKNNEKKV